jgi:hypothetical protein
MPPYIVASVLSNAVYNSIYNLFWNYLHLFLLFLALKIAYIRYLGYSFSSFISLVKENLKLILFDILVLRCFYDYYAEQYLELSLILTHNGLLYLYFKNPEKYAFLIGGIVCSLGTYIYTKINYE